MLYDSFTAIDFETANRYPNSACSVGLVQVRSGRVVRRACHPIRPPFRRFDFTYLHGIDAPAVRHAPSFSQLWPRVVDFFQEIDFLAAHNAAFDRRVLGKCCDWYGLTVPSAPFLCTVQVARRRWGLYPTTLPDVARFLGLPLDHHDAASDAAVCAEIVLRSRAD